MPARDAQTKRRGLGARAAASWLALGAAAACEPPLPPVEAGPPPSAPPAAVSAEAAKLTPAQIARRITPSVVTIRSASSLGSGFVVKEDGWIATNLHVLTGAEELRVVLADGSEYSVSLVVALDAAHDLAVLGIDKTALPAIVLGESGDVHPGDAVVAIGHPLGLEDTVSDGLVSAVRTVEPGFTLLQISAPIAPGSSGGPLIDDQGHVIGIATAVSREGQNLAFGVPSEYLKALLAHPAPVPWAAFRDSQTTVPLPAVAREVPHHDLRVLAGCGEGDLHMLVEMIGRAIDVGAPLYNAGNFAACYHIYEGAALDADRRLGTSCTGVKTALATGRRKAAARTDPSAQAWAMRDTFDGLVEVVVRKLKP